MQAPCHSTDKCDSARPRLEAEGSSAGKVTGGHWPGRCSERPGTRCKATVYSTGASDTSADAPGLTVMVRRVITRRPPFMPSMT
jgi:hypothetical protein